jgi:hypothetical protein
MNAPKGMDMQAARIVAIRETYSESAAICITSGLRVTIRWIAWEIPEVIVLIPVSSSDFKTDHRITLKNGIFQ